MTVTTLDRLIEKGYLSSRPSDPNKELRGRPKNLLSITPEGLTALERTVENAVGLAELFARYSGRKKWKDSLLRLLRGAAGTLVVGGTNSTAIFIDLAHPFATPFSVSTGHPAGLALIPGQRLMTSCGDVLDIGTGAVVYTVPGVSADEIWYNPGDERVYFGGFFSVPVVNGLPPYNVIGTLPWTGHFTPPPPQFSHSIAADSENNHVFLPVTNVGVMVFTDDRDNGEGPDN